MTTNIGIHHIIGESPWTHKVRKRILQVAGYRYSVLVTGPSGTGKELVARSIHTHSPRADKPFIPVNCAALPSGLFASQLFGHVKGAFTGAAFNSLGCFRAAEGGTIFLDEIGELDLELQAKLLRVIQERKVTPVGSHEGIPVDVRIVCATNRNLEEEVRAGRFRMDLYYRLNVVSVETASLESRPEDIGVLAQHFLAKASVENGSDIKVLSPAALALLESYSWPGNIRELQNLIERAVVFTEGDVIGPECFPQLVEAVQEAPVAQESIGTESEVWEAAEANGVDDSWMTLWNAERNHILRTLQKTYYNQSAAARLLGIDRKLLARKVKKYGLRTSPAEHGSG